MNRLAVEISSKKEIIWPRGTCMPRPSSWGRSAFSRENTDFSIETAPSHIMQDFRGKRGDHGR
jgi:hypothetical protein